MPAAAMDTLRAGQNDLDREIRAARRRGAIFPTAVPDTRTAAGPARWSYVGLDRKTQANSF